MAQEQFVSQPTLCPSIFPFNMRVTCGVYNALVTDVGTQLIISDDSSNLTYSPRNSRVTPLWSANPGLTLSVAVAHRKGPNIAAVEFTNEYTLYVCKISGLTFN